MRWLQRLAEVLLPTRCVVCGHTGAHAVCLACQGGLEPVGPRACLRCGRRRQTEYASPDCGECSGRNLGYNRARSMLVYNDLGRALLAEFKYHSRVGVGQVLAGRLCDWLGPDLAVAYARPGLRFDLVVPVPLHPGRLRERRYNQAELIARRVARHYRLPCSPELLTRRRDTPTQVGLTAPQREANVHGAFEVAPGGKPRLKDATVLLVDDLMTTGATLGACARSLWRGGAHATYGLTLFSTHHDTLLRIADQPPVREV